MSHYSRIKTQFHNREALIASLKNLGHEVEADTVIQGHHGEHSVDIAVRKTEGYGIGFVKSAERHLRHGCRLVGRKRGRGTENNTGT